MNSEPESEPSPWEDALRSANLRDLQDTTVASLIRQAAAEIATNGIVDEVGALRILLARLVTEERNLEILTTNVTRVVSVALQAARTRHLIGDPQARELGTAMAIIQDEIEDKTRKHHTGLTASHPERS